MSVSPTIEPAAPVAAPPVVPDGATPTPDTFEVPENVQRLIKNLGLGDEAPAPEGEPKPDKPSGAPKPEAKPKDDKAAAPTSDKVTPTPDEKPITVRREKLVRPPLPFEQPKAPGTPAAPEAEYTPDPQWEKTLEENEREILDDAREAERLFPDRYKGLTTRTAKFLRDHAELTAKPEFDDQDPKYQQWLKANQPQLSRREIREIEAARATSHVKKEYDSRLGDMQHKIFVREQEPKLMDEGKAMFAELTHTALPKEVATELQKLQKEHGPQVGFEKAREAFGLELDVAQNVLAVVTDDLTEFRRITLKDPETGRPLQPILVDPPKGDPDDPGFQREWERYQQHKRLGQLVDGICAEFSRTAPAQEQLKNGRWFVTRDEMMRLPANKRGQYWTFTNAELIERAKKNVPGAISEAIKRRREELQRYGWTPKGVTAAPKVETPPPQPTGAPRMPGPSPIPGGSDPSSEIDARASRLAKVLNRE